jgi:hypothetical protein
MVVARSCWADAARGWDDKWGLCVIECLAGVLSCGEDRNLCTRVWSGKAAWAWGASGGRSAKPMARLG